MRTQHASIEHVIDGQYEDPFQEVADRNDARLTTQTTSLSLARSLAIGCLSRLDKSLRTVNVWDPAAGTGFAGHMLVTALRAAGVDVQYRGQDINEPAISAARIRFESLPGTELAIGNTLEQDISPDFSADLVIVDAPWGLDWTCSASLIEERQRNGEFKFGLPNLRDSTWLFISLALEKLRPASDGGGRVAALIPPKALSSGGKDASIRREILAAGYLESITRLPEGLAPNTKIPLYLLTFASGPSRNRQGTTMIADLQAQFTTSGRHRSMTREAFLELESGLRTGKSGPRNRNVPATKFTRRDAKLVRTVGNGRQISWRLTTYNDTKVAPQYLESRYGLDSGIRLDRDPNVIVDFDPSRLLGDDSREILKDLAGKRWPAQRLTRLLLVEPKMLKNGMESNEGDLLIPTARNGIVSIADAGSKADAQSVSVQVDGDAIQKEFLAAWLNSECGVASRRRAIETGSTGALVGALLSDVNSLMRWADELIVPLPPPEVQQSVSSADEKLASYYAELETRRASIWNSPDRADAIVGSVSSAFDDSLTSWIDQLPYPIATALWTAETTESVGDKQLAYMHAWESIVAFHATVLLSACRRIPGSEVEVEASIRRTFEERHLGIERASWGTWTVIAEKASKVIREALTSDDRDEVARVRMAFADLGESGVWKLASIDLIKKFNEVNTKRNLWLGHVGFTSDEKKQLQIDALIADLRELRQILGDVWTQLTLVRARSADRNRQGYTQTAEVAVGTNSPFRKKSYKVGDPMMIDELYLVKDGAESPLPLLQFVQLRTAPSDARYTTYFYNRTEGDQVRLVSYQYGSESEVKDDAVIYRQDFGALLSQ